MSKSYKLWLGASMSAVLLAVPLLTRSSIAAPITAVQNIDFVQREQTAPPHIKTLLTNLRAEIAKEKLPFSVGYTTALDYKESEITGLVISMDTRNHAVERQPAALKLFQEHIIARDEYFKLNPKFVLQLPKTPTTKMKEWDFRSTGKVSPVEDQGQAETCWDFGACGALDANYLIVDGEPARCSEQQVLDYSNSGDSAHGGDHISAMKWLVDHGVTSETDDAYTHNKNLNPPADNFKTLYQATASGLVTTETDPGFAEPRIPTEAEMKQALVDHGPLAVAILVDNNFQAYTDGVLKETLPDATLHPVWQQDTANPKRKVYATNHIIMIIGWDDSKHAWIIKNSWGTGWGSTCGIGTDRGYAYIDYNTANIGAWAGWITAKSDHYSPPKPGQPTKNIKAK